MKTGEEPPQVPHATAQPHQRAPQPDTSSHPLTAPPARRREFQLEAPTISLPTGGGAIKGIDEKLSTNPSRGTVTLSLPLPFSPARDGFTPPVQLSYDSGAGNSVVGTGWSLGFPSVRRRTDHRLPTYRDDEDTFVLAGGDDLVPVDAGTPVGDLVVRRYRPRIERDFDRIEHVHHPVKGSWWRVTSRDNVTTLYGTDDDHRIADPVDGTKVLEWLPVLTVDDRGNCLVWTFEPENLDNVAQTPAEANRHRGIAAFANRHLKRLQYGNLAPCALDEAHPYTAPAPTGGFLFEAVFDYGEHDPDHPMPEGAAGRRWTARSDPWSDHRGGFDRRTYRLVQRVLAFHTFAKLDDGEPTLVRSLDLAYTSTPELTFLASATQCGYLRKDDGAYAKQTLPPFELAYEPVAWDTGVRVVDPESVAHLPAGVHEGYQWLDLYSEGIAGVFTEQAGAWHYKANLGDVDEDGRVRLDALRPVAPKPSFVGMATGALQLLDLEADGRKQVVVRSPEVQGFFELDRHDDWMPFRAFIDVVRIDLAGRHLRMLDLSGDGRADILVSEDDAFLWYRSEGARGFGPAARAPKPLDEERGPAVVFSDEQQRIFLADMAGDGLVDIVRIRNGEVCYWPNLGYGRFGAKVTMDNAPVFDHPDLYDPRLLHLADLTGTGATDVVYVGGDGCRAYLNRSGNGWDEGHVVTAPFPPSLQATVSTADLLGNGTACLVWSSSLPADADAPMRYVDPMGGRKPHLLTRGVDNLGQEVTFSYKSSTWHYLKDKAEGRPWITRLPFPVHCLRRTETRDRISGARHVSEFRYHHGHYDSVEREFRGFGMVEQVDAEDFEHWAAGTGGALVDRTLHQPPVLTKTWFHTGVFDGHDEVLTHFRDEYWDRAMAREGFAAAADEPALPDARLISVDATPEARRQALRSCKGMVLRREVFALDAPATGASDEQRRRQLSPYTVATHNCVVEQPAPGVFTVKESEAVTYHYDRVLDDPRVEHTLNVRVDELGNVVESATVVYGRRMADASLPQAVRTAQGRTSVTYVRNGFTADAVTPVHHRLRKPSRTSTYEITGLPRPGPLYVIADFDRDGFHVLDDSVEVPHHERTAVPPADTVNRRLLSRRETVYYDGDLQAALPLDALHYRALPFETYELAVTDELLAHVFADRADDAVMTEGGYVHRGDAHWWIGSGRQVYLDGGNHLADATGRFFVPVAHVDALGARTDIGWFGDSFLLQAETTDAAGNRTSVTAFDLRALAPRSVVDANDNRIDVLLDELGRVKATAVRGKGDEADDLDGLVGWSTPAETATEAAFLTDAGTASAGQLLRRASTRLVYDVHRYRTSGGTQPAVVATIRREVHAAVQAEAPVQVGFEYSNGSGEVELTKVQAEPGTAKRVTIRPDDTVEVEEVDTAAAAPPRLRWLGTGRTVRNNKGKAVKEYEPFFSVTPAFESHKELVESGVTHVRSYDPVDRLVRTDHPDGTFSRIDFSSWHVEEHDRNDTVLESDWHDRRVNHLIDAELTAAGRHPAREAEAAQRAAAHADTPFTRHLDPRGDTVLEVQHNGVDGGGQPVLYPTRNEHDVTGGLVSVTDPRGTVTVAYERDLRGELLFVRSADGGRRWLLHNAAGDPLRTWDDRGHRFVFRYDDPLHRPTAKRVVGGDGDDPLDHVFERVVYGEGRPDDKARNLRTRPAVLYDTAGRVENVRFDFKGGLLASSRRFAADYKAVPHWDGPAPDTALEVEAFESTAAYDALDRLRERTAADGTTYRPTYNAANLLETVTVVQDGDDEVVVKDVDYDEKGQRQRVVFGNDVTVAYVRDPETFRLTRITSTRGNGSRLQDVHYTYDPVGNVTHALDECTPTVWFGGIEVSPVATYRYDALYRLVGATGREHAGQAGFGAADNWNDDGFRKRYDPNDALAWRPYAEAYEYDEVGNLLELAHTATGGEWVRTYAYAADSNRLRQTTVGQTDYRYEHHAAHGFLTKMPHLPVMRWNFRDELQAAATQAVAAGAVPETTWYVYDGSGARVRKVTERAGGGAKKAARYYLDGVEISREYGNGGAVATERQTFDVVDDRTRIALIERETVGPDAPRRVVRYQGPDLLLSAAVETDEQGRVISYEAFHPFGTTAYQAVDKTIAAAAKRYRFTGMERDEESGLEYHSARYYVPWLGRWTAPDTHPEKLDGNRYAYVRNNPVVNRDPNGLFEEPVHGQLTYRLAMAAGFTEAEAAEIAIADAGMDHVKETRPGDGDELVSQIKEGRTREYHYPTQAEASAQLEADISTGVSNLAEFGHHLHSYQDVGTPKNPGPHERGPHTMQRDLFVIGGFFLAFTASLAYGGVDFALKQSGVGAFIFFTLALLSLTATVVALDVAAHGQGIGHPHRHTERGAQSDWDKTVADQAFQDPRANRDQFNETFQLLREAYIARAKAQGRPIADVDDAAARQAISETIAADDACKLNDLVNRPVGPSQQSWAQVRRRVRWGRERELDISVGEDTRRFSVQVRELCSTRRR